MSFKENVVLPFGVCLFVCSGPVGVIAFVGLYKLLNHTWE
jgi:hypothetical protein